jgi:hypothetical protein
MIMEGTGERPGVALFGRLGMWPGNRRARPEPAPAAPPPVPAGDQP